MKHEIVICMGSSCFARGNKKHLLMIEQYLADHGLMETVVLSGSRCEDQCRTGPNIRIDGQLYGEITGERLLELLSRHLSA
ncbi:MAG: (2Fe-2S) ferredoxin domain-containing protein [Solidesulfovibrio sp.]|jgi:NADH:ubiquinone oxidoreductase subunit E